MTRGMFMMALAGFLCGFICPMSFGQPKPGDDPMEVLAKKLAERLAAKKCARVTVLDFGDIRNRPNELGRYLALQLANELVNLTDVAVLDRANLETIMREHKLTAEGLLKPEEAKKLGQFAGVDAILIGNVSLIGQNVETIVRAICTETSEIVASGKAAVPATDELRRMLGLGVEVPSAGSGDAGGPAAAEGPSIATREIGPITAVLRNVAELSVQTEQGAVPAIRCTFDLENRNLQRHAAVAVNQRLVDKWVRGPQTYRGELVDANRIRWSPIEVNGIAGVICCEFRGGQASQGYPAAIVDYIRTGTRFDPGSPPTTAGTYGRYWTGFFSSIPPGQKIRMTVDFVPAAKTDQRDRAPNSRPDYFQFDMELVLATYAEGEDPAKARDLMLRNLTIDRVVLAKEATTSKP